jgi:hypothetical protein
VGSNPALPILVGSARTCRSLDLPGHFNVESALVAAQQYSNAVITEHASAQMRRRGIEVPAVHGILSNPEQIVEVRPGRVVVQARRKVDNRMQLIRMFVDVDQSPPRVVTAYRTSKIDKYWSSE